MQNKSTEKELLFKYDRWMARDQEDFDIVRELPAVTEGEEALPGNYFIFCCCYF